MAGLMTLKDIYKEKGASFIEKLLNHYVIVTELIDGTRFRVERKNDKFIFYKGNEKNPINLIDRTICIYYERPIKFFQSLSQSIKDLMPEDWEFCFEYIPNNHSNNIIYDKVPKNYLIITDILIKGSNNKITKIITDKNILEKWSNTFDVQGPAIIFQGKLDYYQRERIIDFIKAETSDLDKIFELHSLSRYIINIINPSLKETALNNSLDKIIKSIGFKFINGKSTINAQIIDPSYRKIIEKNQLMKKPNDTYQIIMLDILEFLSSKDINDYSIIGKTKDERYIDLISSIFNDYVNTNGYKYVGIDFQTPVFAKQEEFALNFEFISNEQTKKILKNEKIHDLFKIMLTSFKKRRKYSTDLLSAETIEVINNIIDKIENKINNMYTENEVMDFKSYMQHVKMQSDEDDVNIFEHHTNEALSLKYKTPGKERVNIFVGRFQPFTMGHVKVFKQIHEQNGLPVVVMIVRGGKPDPERRPFNEDIQIRMFKAMQKEFKYLKDVFITPNAAPDTLFNLLRPKYEPVLWGAGTDRYNSYQKMIDKYREELGANSDFNAYEIKRTGENISATKVRNAIKDDNEKDFTSWTPKSIWPLYDEMQKIILSASESIKFKIKSFVEFLNEVYTNDKDYENINESRGRKSLSAWIIEQLIYTYPSNYDKHSAARRIKSKGGTTIEQMKTHIQDIFLNNSESKINDIIIVDPYEISPNNGIVHSSQFYTIELDVDGEHDFITLAKLEGKGPTTEQHETCSIYAFEKALKYGDTLVANYIGELEQFYPSISEDKAWLQAFQAQVNALVDYMKGIDTTNYSFFRDAQFTDKLYSYARKLAGFKAKDSWQPADVWIVDNPDKRINEILQLDDINEINAYLSEGIINRTIIPISLKKTKKTASLVEVNLSSEASSNKDKILEINCDLLFDTETKKFKNNGANVKMQSQAILTLRFSSGTSFTIEAAQKGAVAQLGKVPAHIYRNELKSNFSAADWMREFNINGNNYRKLEEYFNNLSKSKLVNTNGSDWDNFIEGMNILYENKATRGSLFAQKALAMEACNNIILAKDSDTLMTKLLLSAQKKGKDFGPFIKIY